MAHHGNVLGIGPLERLGFIGSRQALNHKQRILEPAFFDRLEQAVGQGFGKFLAGFGKFGRWRFGILLNILKNMALARAQLTFLPQQNKNPSSGNLNLIYSTFNITDFKYKLSGTNNIHG